MNTTYVKLPIYFEDDEEQDKEFLSSIGVKTNITPLEDLPINMMIFFNIDSIAPYEENDKIFSQITSGRYSYISNVPYNEILEYIKNNIKTL